MTAVSGHSGRRLTYLTHALSADMQEHARRFAMNLTGANAVAVAFSGGVDSSVTVALTARALGPDQVIAVLGVSPSLSEVERTQAQATARSLGVECREVLTFELNDPDYVANRGNRCYFCKYELYTRAFTRGVTELDCDLFVNGDTIDDHSTADRPGRRAATELGVRSPLAEAGIAKSDVRALAHELGLIVWDKPSAPCLASRVALNTPVTRARLAQIDRAETALRALGLHQLRVRHLGETAQVELGPAEIERVRDRVVLSRMLELVTDAGFLRAELAEAPLYRP